MPRFSIDVEIVDHLFLDLVSVLERVERDMAEAAFFLVAVDKIVFKPINEKPAILVKRNRDVAAHPGFRFCGIEGVHEGKALSVPDDFLRLQDIENGREHQLGNVFPVMFDKEFDAPSDAVVVDDDVRETAAGRVTDERQNRRRKALAVEVFLKSPEILPQD